MKSLKSLLLAALLLLSLPLDAEAKCGRKLSTDSVDELTTFSGAPASGDYIPICDTSANVMKKVDASNITLAGAFNGTVGATTPSTGAFTSLTTTLGVAHTRTPAADTGTTNNGSSVAYTVPADTTGTNTHNAYNVSPTISNATGGTNTFNGYNFANVTGDAQIDVTAFRVGTGSRSGTTTGMIIGSGWDKGIDITNTAGADSALTEMGIDLNVTTPVDTTGTNDHWGLNIDFSIGNASGGTNSARGINIANVTGDSQVNVTGLKIGTGTTLGTSNAIDIGTGWDAALSIGSPFVTTSTITGDGGDALVGFLNSQVTSTTTTLTIAQCGATIVNDSADVLTLPEASTALGCRYTFVVANASNMDINPNDGTDTILPFADYAGAGATISPSAGDAIRGATAGMSITLEAVGANAWAVINGAQGTWADVN